MISSRSICWNKDRAYLRVSRIGRIDVEDTVTEYTISIYDEDERDEREGVLRDEGNVGFQGERKVVKQQGGIAWLVNSVERWKGWQPTEQSHTDVILDKTG